MSASVKQKDWSLAASPFSFGNRYKFILCCQQRGIIWRAAGNSLAEVGLCPFAEVVSRSFWLSVVCSAPLQCSCLLWHCSGSKQGLFGISLRRKKKKYQQDWPVRSLYRNCLEGERRKYMLWDFIDLIPLYHNPLGAHILGYNTAWTPWIFKFFHLPPPVSMERKPVISIWQIGNRSKGFTEKREGEVLKLEPRV